MTIHALNSGNPQPHMIPATATTFPLNAMQLDTSADVDFTVPVSIYNNSATAANLKLIPAGAADDADSFFVKIPPYGFAPFRVRKIIVGTSTWTDTLIAVY